MTIVLAILLAVALCGSAVLAQVLHSTRGTLLDATKALMSATVQHEMDVFLIKTAAEVLEKAGRKLQSQDDTISLLLPRAVRDAERNEDYEFLARIKAGEFDADA